ncbi:hypothetical protein B0I27_11723 [Arcticibacter pallidicorallinus]|uniref:Uncharacterized protein n=1 Tax=Arcticibacter pallidicorallinus TaxID=1259464 RepID=A0A2T0TQT6_9SPHI|nr:hypothetical protein B0I27_11723 [Arcticibacter pallidicorallinus]
MLISISNSCKNTSDEVVDVSPSSISNDLIEKVERFHSLQVEANIKDDLNRKSKIKTSAISTEKIKTIEPMF